MPDLPTTPRAFSTDDLGSALNEIMEHLDSRGWGQSPSVFALAPTALLHAQLPEVIADDGSVFTPVEEDVDDLDEFLASAVWPEEVAGAAVSMEIVIADPEDDDDRTPRFVVTDTGDHHPGEEAARLVVGVLRTGSDLALMRLRPVPDGEPELLTHPQLALELRAALRDTFAPDLPESSDRG
ncbi:PPA1309 family protein [Gordonia sp. p3-SID1431]|uniref:PPA1309 family protein n=1 Tax=Gordonia sp. p3-SID1431 TaxID=2916159 RepID=UPI0021A8CEC5|nr:PPA1309 family protein [Gordonia sp. p3-SID1431]MCT1355239.1 PPA1309 family protein [Gordonia sp. p3-SID1431]